MKKVKEPQFSFRFNKHHVKDFYVLVDSKDSMTLCENDRAKKNKYVGPAILEIEQKGTKRKITRYSLKSKKIWGLINSYAKIGIWALNTRLVSPFLPNEFLSASNRYRGMDEKQRARLKKIANKTARSRFRRG